MCIRDSCKNREDAIAQFDVSLERTGAGYFDFYLLHNLGESRTRYFDEFGMWSWIQEKKADVYKRQPYDTIGSM